MILRAARFLCVPYAEICVNATLDHRSNFWRVKPRPHEHVFTLKSHSLFARVYGEICQVFPWQVSLLKSWYASFSTSGLVKEKLAICSRPHEQITFVMDNLSRSKLARVDDALHGQLCLQLDSQWWRKNCGTMHCNPVQQGHATLCKIQDDLPFLKPNWK